MLCKKKTKKSKSPSNLKQIKNYIKFFIIMKILKTIYFRFIFPQQLLYRKNLHQKTFVHTTLGINIICTYRRVAQK